MGKAFKLQVRRQIQDNETAPDSTTETAEATTSEAAPSENITAPDSNAPAGS